MRHRLVCTLAGAAVVLAGCGRLGFDYLEMDAGVGGPVPLDAQFDAPVADADPAGPADATDAHPADAAEISVHDAEADTSVGEDASDGAEPGADAGAAECHLSAAGTLVPYRAGDAAELEGTYILGLEQTGLCAAPAGCSATLGAEVRQATCDRSACQMWEAYAVGNGNFALRNVATGACLYMSDAADGTQAISWECSSYDKLYWRASCAAAGETWRLVSAHSNKSLQGDGQNAPGAGIDQGPEADSPWQRWTLSTSTTAIETVMASSEGAVGQTWRFTTSTPASTWVQSSFDDSSWSTGPGGFGDADRGRTPARTPWTSADLWLRGTFQLSSLPASLSVRIFHDEDAEVYVNGVLAFSEARWSQGYRTVEVPGAVSSALQIGANSIAVHCRSTSTPQFLDVGVAIVRWE